MKNEKVSTVNLILMKVDITDETIRAVKSRKVNNFSHFKHCDT